METAKKSNRKGLIIALMALVLVAAILLVIWIANRPETQSGSKSITVDVIDNENKTTHYTLKTDEEYLISGIKKYVGRIGHYASFEMKELPDRRKSHDREQAHAVAHQERYRRTGLPGSVRAHRNDHSAG